MMEQTQSDTTPYELTILEAVAPRYSDPKPRLAKTIHWQSIQAYDAAYLYNARTVEAHSVAELADVLRDLTAQPHACVVRGGLREGVRPNRIERRCHGDGAPLVEVARNWAAFDLDELYPPEGLLDDPDAVAAWLWGQLPSPLAGCAGVVQWTSGAFVDLFHGRPVPGQALTVKTKGAARCRLWFVLSAPVESGAWRAWARETRKSGGLRVDPCLFSPVQPHYTAAPAFEGRVPVMLDEERVVVMEGASVVDVAGLLAGHSARVAVQAREREAREVQAAQRRASSEDDAHDWACAQSALERLDPDLSYDEWLSVGMAIHSRWPTGEGLGLWEGWSRGGGKYQDGDCEHRWDGFRGGGVNLGTLFSLAKSAGWTMPAREVVGAREARLDVGGVVELGEVPERVRATAGRVRGAAQEGAGGEAFASADGFEGGFDDFGTPMDGPPDDLWAGHPAEFGSAPEFGNGPEFGAALGEASAPPDPPDPPKPEAPVPPARDLVAEARARVAQIVREVAAAPDKLERIKALLLDGGVLAALGLLPAKEAEVFFFDLSQHRGAGKLVAALRRAYKDHIKEAASEEAQIITDSRPRGPQPGQFAVGDEERWWSYGAEVHAYRVRRVERAEVVVAQLLAWSVWPQARTMDLHSGDHGAEVIYRTPQGAKQRAVIEAGAWVDEGSASAAAGRLARCGARIAEGAGAAFTLAIGAWANRASAETRISVGRPGWQREPGSGRLVYVNGAEVHGASWLWTGGPLRSARKGDLEAWRTKTLELATTQGLKLALGVSFAGALLDPLDLDPFLVHIHGASSGGKTRAAKLAAAVWHNPADLLRYNGSQKGLVLATEERASACVALDEIKEISPEELATFLHTFTDGRSRTLAQRTGQALQEQRRFRATGFSTGEASMGERLGDLQQGGQAVRAVDVELLVGEACQSEAHADELDALVAECHGVAGDAWAAWLAGLGEAGWEQVRAEVGRIRSSLGASVGEDRELGRIARAVAVACAALRLASACGAVGVAFSEGDAKSLAAWTLERARFNRGERISPESRALDSLRSAYVVQPDAFPTEESYRTTKRAGGVWGITETRDAAKRQDDPPLWVPTGKILTIESMIQASKICEKAGVGPRRFFAFLQQQGMAFKARRSVGGVQREWWVVDLGKQEAAP